MNYSIRIGGGDFMNKDVYVDKDGFIYNRQQRINETVESVHLADGNVDLSYIEMMRESATKEFDLFAFLDELKDHTSIEIDKQKAQFEIERRSILLNRNEKEA